MQLTKEELVLLDIMLTSKISEYEDRISRVKSNEKSIKDYPLCSSDLVEVKQKYVIIQEKIKNEIRKENENV